MGVVGWEGKILPRYGACRAALAWCQGPGSCNRWRSPTGWKGTFRSASMAPVSNYVLQWSLARAKKMSAVPV